VTPIYLADLAWPDVEALLAQDNRLILITGATEQHGRHLPLGTDTVIPQHLAARLSTRSGVPIAPPLPFGMSESHMAFPGTFTLTTDTLQTLYLEIIQSAYRQGWRRLFVLNGHGGNRAAWNWASALAMKVKADLRVHVTHWWAEDAVRALAVQAVGRNEGHAGLEETAAMLVSRPHLVKLSEAEGHPDAPDGIWSQPPDEVRATLPLGAIGANPADATADLGEQMLERLTRDYLAILDGAWA
jgi:creatinine amidohydrolase